MACKWGQVETGLDTINSLSLENLVVSLRDEMIVVEGDVLSSKPMPHRDLLQLKQQLSERLGERLELRLMPRIKL
jgi:hypothetical protein